MSDAPSPKTVAAGQPFELLKPPLYWRNHLGKRSRIYSPPAAERCRLRAVVYARDGFACQGCGRVFDHPENYDGLRNIDGLSLGHIIDYRDGGPYVEANLRAECRKCNLGNAYMVPKGSPSRTRQAGRYDGSYGATI